MPRGRRVGLWDQHTRARQERLAAMTPEQRQLARRLEKARKLQPVATAPVKGDPFAIDWEAHECGYVPRTGDNGKPLPKSGPHAEPAWRWTEQPNTTGRPCLHTTVMNLALVVYRIGFRHNPVELHTPGGFPDNTHWGPGGLIVRELKAMRPDWKRGQKQHLLSLREAGVDVGVWYPCCLLAGLIDEEMAALAGVKPKGTYARRAPGVPNKPLTWEDIANGALTGGD